MSRCDHCLIEFPERDAVRQDVEGVEKVFCCNGCKGIYLLIHQEGLDNFYAKRQWAETGINTGLLDKKVDLAPFEELVHTVDGRNEIDVYIDGIRCASCVWLNERILGKTPGIEFARVNYATHQARIRWDPEVVGLDEIIGRIQSIG